MKWDVPDRWQRFKTTYYVEVGIGSFLAMVGLISYLSGNMMMNNATTDIEELRAVGQGILGIIWMAIGWFTIALAVLRRDIYKRLDWMGDTINENVREIEVLQTQSREKK